MEIFILIILVITASCMVMIAYKLSVCENKLKDIVDEYEFDLNSIRASLVTISTFAKYTSEYAEKTFKRIDINKDKLEEIARDIKYANEHMHTINTNNTNLCTALIQRNKRLDIIQGIIEQSGKSLMCVQHDIQLLAPVVSHMFSQIDEQKTLCEEHRRAKHSQEESNERKEVKEAEDVENVAQEPNNEESQIDLDKEEAVRLHNDGWGINRIAKKLHRGNSTVRRWVK